MEILLVIGIHLADERDDEVFTKSYVRFQGIEQWLGHEPFSRDYDHESSCLTVKARKPRETHFADHNDFKVTTVGSLFSNNEPDTHFSIEVLSQLAIQPDSPKSLDWHLSHATKLQELASLCSGHYLPLISLELRGPQEKIGDATRPSEVHLYARMVHTQNGSPLKSKTPIISEPELISFNKQAVQSWFDQYEILNPAIALFITVTAQREMFTNIRLLLALQALEVFHRRTAVDGIMPPD